MLKIKEVIIITASMFLMLPVPAFALEFLEPLPGLSSENVSLSSYLGWLFPFILTVVAVLAVIMIVIGGLELAGGGSEGLKTGGKNKIEGAIYGLLLAVSAYLILYTINPDLVNMKLGIAPAVVKQRQTDIGVTTGTNTISATFDASAEAYNTREKCEQSGINTHGERFIGGIFGGGKCTWVYKK